MVNGADGAERRNQLRQQLLSLDKRQGAEIKILEPQQVEEEQRRGQLGGRALHVARRGEQRALLQPLEDGPAAVVEHRDFPVGDEALGGQRQQRAGQIGKHRRRVRPAAIEDARPRPVARDEGAKAVVFQLEDPGRIVERVRAGLGQHRLRVLDGAPRRAKLHALRADLRRQLSTLRELLHQQAREHRPIVVRSPAADVPVAGFLDEQPFFSGRAFDPHQRPHPFQLESFELKQKLPRRHARAWIAHRLPAPAVPHHHRPRAVVPVGDHPLEIGVFDRVVLGLHRQPLLGGVGRGAARDRPRFQNAVPLQPQIIMKPRR